MSENFKKHKPQSNKRQTDYVLGGVRTQQHHQKVPLKQPQQVRPQSIPRRKAPQIPQKTLSIPNNSTTSTPTFINPTNADIGKLPDYILSLIFTALVELDLKEVNNETLLLRFDPLRNVSQVCKRWNKVVQLLPSHDIGLGCSLQLDPFFRKSQYFKQYQHSHSNSSSSQPQKQQQQHTKKQSNNSQQQQQQVSNDFTSPRTLTTTIGKMLKKISDPSTAAATTTTINPSAILSDNKKQEMIYGDEKHGGRGPLALLKIQSTIKTHSSKIYAQNWKHDNSGLATTGNDGKLTIHSPNGTQNLSLTLTSAWIMTCALSPSAKLCACGGLDHIVSVYDLTIPSTNPQPLPIQLGAHTGFVSCIRFLNDEQHCVSCSEDSTCRIWDIETRSVIERYSEHTGDVLCVEVSPICNQVFCSCGTDKTIIIWDSRVHSPVAAMRTHTLDVNNISWSDNSNAIASSSDDQTFRIYDVRMRKEIRQLRSDLIQGYNTGVSLSSSGRFLFGSCESNVLVFDTFVNRQICMFNTGSRIACIDVSPDGTMFATSNVDGTTRFYTPSLDS